MTSPTIQIIEQSQVARLLPKRPGDSHKGLFGTVTVIGGASGMTGAPLLAARAALKLGAGCVHVVLLAENAPAVDCLQPELMLHNAGDFMDTPLAASLSKDNSVITIGCGMGSGELAGKLLAEALRSQATLVLDADALNLIAAHPDLRDLTFAREAATVLTPHPGEAARLLGCSTAEIQADRVAAIQKLTSMFTCPIVLKGADSLCATRRGLFVNKTGNPGMSGPGMGDVLAGMIAALLAQGLNADDALLLAVHLHGAAGDELAKQFAVGMTATELTDQARRLLNHWHLN